MGEIIIPKQLQKKEINFVLIEKGGKKPFQQNCGTRRPDY